MGSSVTNPAARRVLPRVAISRLLFSLPQVMDPTNGLTGSVPNKVGTEADGSARSRYHVGINDITVVNGNIEVAYWSTNVNNAPSLFYNVKNATVDSLECSGGELKNAELYVGDDSSEKWGDVVECERGPILTDVLNMYPDKPPSPPTIILTGPDGDVHVIVEESSTYPSFLYSVWKSEKDVGTSFKLHHQFHIGSTMRLAEAVVTGIVHHGKFATGGGCFGLVRLFSEINSKYPTDIQRASPFGEHPTVDSSTVTKVSQVENIEDGVEIDLTALVCAVWLMALASIGIAWSILLRSSIGMDVYDRDELIRAVSLPGATADGSPSAMRIFVRKEDTGNMSVVISETGEKQSGCVRFFGRGAKVAENDNPAPIAGGVAQQDDGAGPGDGPIPTGPRTVWLEGIRTGIGRPFPGREGNFRYPTSFALSASPCHSTVTSLAGTPFRGPPSLVTPSPAFLSRTPVSRNRKLWGGRGASLLFSSEHGPESSIEEVEDDVEMGSFGVQVSAFGGGRDTPTAFKAMVPGTTKDASVGGRVKDGGVTFSSDRTARTAALSEGPLPVPSREFTSDLNLGPPQMNRLTRHWDEEAERERRPSRKRLEETESNRIAGHGSKEHALRAQKSCRWKEINDQTWSDVAEKAEGGRVPA